MAHASAQPRTAAIAMASDKMALACFLSRREKLIANMFVAAWPTHLLAIFHGPDQLYFWQHF